MRFLCLSAICVGLSCGGAFAETIELSAADLTVTGLMTGSMAGSCLASGDFDGDGFDDLAIGAPGTRITGPLGPVTGVIYLAFGGPDAISNLRGGMRMVQHAIIGVRDGQRVGQNIAAGDFNSDGLCDLLIGVPASAEGDTTFERGGGAYLVRGRKRAEYPENIVLPDSADMVFVANGRELHLGEGVALGDWDGDGKDDAAIGEMYANGPAMLRSHAGATYLFFGRDFPKGKSRVIRTAATADVVIHGSDSDDTSGRTLVFADWDADGREDLILGAYYADGPNESRTNPGDAHIVFGRDRKAARALRNRELDLALAEASLSIYGNWTLGALGRSIAAGDLDGDGYAEAIVAAANAPDAGTRAQCGIVDVVFGTSDRPVLIDLAGPPELRMSGSYYFDHLGSTMAAGDLNDDGKAELIIGSPWADPFGADSLPRLQAGEVSILMGRAKAEFPDSLDLSIAPLDHTLRGIDPDDSTPSATVVMDLDGDGKADLVIGAGLADGTKNTHQDAGEIYILLGRDRSW